MRKRAFILVSAMVVAFTVTSCANSPYTKSTQGAVIGGASGALIGQAIGRHTEATLVGALIGTMIGSMIGNDMDMYDRIHVNEAYEFTPSGQPSTWRNPDNGNRYQVVPQEAYVHPNDPNRPCRRAEIIATIDGRTQRTYSTACRDSRGHWVLQN